ncbi:hypothetical protein BGW41_001622 [Actinomortierella wolfii]|nr:hypothetical protein BGW41_001622 [Actinomortierella wolfii]
MDANLTVGKLIGSGGYGSVYHGRWNLRKVAVKKFDFTKQDAQAVDQAVKHEIELLERLRDTNIIQFFGTTYHENRLVLVMEFADGGSLKGAIDSGRLAAGNNPWEEKMRIARDIARGLHFIHTSRILHRDLKSANVLLTKHMDVKLADFGLAVIKSHTSSNSVAAAGGNESAKGTVRWMAPEIFAARPVYSTKSDMYALGMVMWEMAAECTVPFKDHTDTYLLIRLIENGVREILPDGTPADYRGWVERCWEHDRSKRPDASELFVGEQDDEDEAIDLRSLAGSSGFDNGSTTLTLSSLDLQSLNIKDLSSNGAQSTLTLTDHSNDLSTTETSGTTTTPPPGPVFSSVDNESVQQAKALLEALTMAESGNLDGVMTLREIWNQGIGIDKINPNEFSAFLLAAQQGHVQSQYCVAQLFHRGRGTEEESDRDAAYWFHKAAEKGHAPSQTMLAWMYDDGSEGVRQDLRLAAKWYRKAADQGYCIAQACLGLMYASDRGGVRLDYARAIEWYRKAAEQGYAPGQSNLGFMYENGRGVPKDFKQAALWYGKAADQGNVTAAENLSQLLNKIESEE